jgi:hypothetical protein
MPHYQLWWLSNSSASRASSSAWTIAQSLISPSNSSTMTTRTTNYKECGFRALLHKETRVLSNSLWASTSRKKFSAPRRMFSFSFTRLLTGASYAENGYQFTKKLPGIWNKMKNRSHSERLIPLTTKCHWLLFNSQCFTSTGTTWSESQFTLKETWPKPPSSTLLETIPRSYFIIIIWNRKALSYPKLS